jgi:hypothetical protein
MEDLHGIEIVGSGLREKHGSVSAFPKNPYQLIACLRAFVH